MVTQDRGAEGPGAMAMGKGAGAGLGGWERMLSGHPPSRSQLDLPLELSGFQTQGPRKLACLTSSLSCHSHPRPLPRASLLCKFPLNQMIKHGGQQLWAGIRSIQVLF